jgi:prepilin-type processing-associated H-X9-DG protein
MNGHSRIDPRHNGGINIAFFDGHCDKTTYPGRWQIMAQWWIGTSHTP